MQAGIAFFKSLSDEAATAFLDFAGKNDAFPLAITDDAGVLVRRWFSFSPTISSSPDYVRR